MKNKRLLFKAMGGAALIPALAPVAASVRQPDGPGADYFPNVTLYTHDGRKVKFYDDLVKGKTVVFNMMYTVCTGICPTNTASLLSVQQALGPRVGRDIFIYSLTLQPEMDSPRALREYAEKYGVKPGWTFLTGKRDDMEIVRRKLGFYDTDPEADKDITRHTGVLRIGSEARDKWFMTPAVSSTRQIVNSIMNL